ncbi:MAG: hypothetical protein M5U01_20050 [Ardenticatenaceae bacterium]|nr:hypothetical protein [Ardenticatenaceae bacterium]HBY93932.1 hypothetical protein [Chloroflexota bacterium]
MSNPPFSGLEPLRPLCGAGLLYLVLLILLRLLIWPNVRRLRKGNSLQRVLSDIFSFLAYLAFLGLLILATLAGFAALTGTNLALTLDLEQLQPDNISPRLALVVLVALLALALLPIGRGRRR